jgi:hypothetical protein
MNTALNDVKVLGLSMVISLVSTTKNVFVMVRLDTTVLIDSKNKVVLIRVVGVKVEVVVTGHETVDVTTMVVVLQVKGIMGQHPGHALTPLQTSLQPLGTMTLQFVHTNGIDHAILINRNR